MIHSVYVDISIFVNTPVGRQSFAVNHLSTFISIIFLEASHNIPTIVYQILLLWEVGEIL